MNNAPLDDLFNEDFVVYHNNSEPWLMHEAEMNKTSNQVNINPKIDPKPFPKEDFVIKDNNEEPKLTYNDKKYWVPAPSVNIKPLTKFKPDPVVAQDWRKLCFDEELKSGGPDINANFRSIDRKKILGDAEIPLWRRLAGVSNEKMFPQKEVEDMISRISHKIKMELSSLALEWSGDYFDKRLVINGAKTCFSVAAIMEACEGLKKMVCNEDADDVIADIVLKKVKSLFI